MAAFSSLDLANRVVAVKCESPVPEDHGGTAAFRVTPETIRKPRRLQMRHQDRPLRNNGHLKPGIHERHGYLYAEEAAAEHHRAPGAGNLCTDRIGFGLVSKGEDALKRGAGDRQGPWPGTGGN